MDTSNSKIHMSTTKMYIDEKGSKFYKNSKGLFHKLDGPAIERKNGIKEWYKEGERHRLDGPALEFLNGTKLWCKEGRRHRIDGPALEWANGKKYWYILGNHLEEKEFNSWILRIKIFI